MTGNRINEGQISHLTRRRILRAVMEYYWLIVVCEFHTQELEFHALDRRTTKVSSTSANICSASKSLLDGTTRTNKLILVRSGMPLHRILMMRTFAAALRHLCTFGVPSRSEPSDSSYVFYKLLLIRHMAMIPRPEHLVCSV
jgi:hypothetical protein